MSDDKNTIAVVIPCISNVLLKIAACDQRGIGTFVQTLISSINKRFENIETQRLVIVRAILPSRLCRNYALATALDPRFKAHPFGDKSLLLARIPEWVNMLSETKNDESDRNAPILVPASKPNAAESDDLLVSYADAPPILWAPDWKR
jgi:hypothetical protein